MIKSLRRAFRFSNSLESLISLFDTFSDYKISRCLLLKIVPHIRSVYFKEILQMYLDVYDRNDLICILNKHKTESLVLFQNDKIEIREYLEFSISREFVLALVIKDNNISTNLMSTQLKEGSELKNAHKLPLLSFRYDREKARGF